MVKPKMWMVRAGKQGTYFSQFAKENLISTGFEVRVNLKKIKTENEMKQAVGKKYKYSARNLSILSKQLNIFCNKLQKNDYVITYNVREKKYLIGIIVSEYAYRRNSKTFQNRREVKWIAILSKNNIPETIKKDLSRNTSLFEINSTTKNTIVKLSHKIKKEYEMLKDKWQNAEPGANFGAVEVAAGKFYTYEISSYPTGVYFQMTCCFEDAKDAIAYYRYSATPFFYEDEWGDWSEEKPFSSYDEDDKEERLHMLKIMEMTLITDSIPEKLINKILSSGKVFPDEEIRAWGSLENIISYILDDINEDLPEKLPKKIDVDSCLKLYTKLNNEKKSKVHISSMGRALFSDNMECEVTIKQLIQSKTFDEYNPKHLALAKIFLQIYNTGF